MSTVFSCVASRNKREETTPGFRGYYVGTLSNTGSSGFSWSSTIRSIYGQYFDLAMTSLYPSNSSGRAHGLQLRCLSE
ncbi:hypothetical protein [uncultured Rikenella sp.]|uniref:hypothetical protein n=1 Tax=uncultured Rikenella sp. TaxID=368003 RepID=UPI00261EDD88|nr:hypothetical protein [uncultured Rikenella sp.]